MGTLVQEYLRLEKRMNWQNIYRLFENIIIFVRWCLEENINHKKPAPAKFTNYENSSYQLCRLCCTNDDVIYH